MRCRAAKLIAGAGSGLACMEYVSASNLVGQPRFSYLCPSSGWWMVREAEARMREEEQAAQESRAHNMTYGISEA